MQCIRALKGHLRFNWCRATWGRGFLQFNSETRLSIYFKSSRAVLPRFCAYLFSYAPKCAQVEVVLSRGGWYPHWRFSPPSVWRIPPNIQVKIGPRRSPSLEIEAYRFGIFLESVVHGKLCVILACRVQNSSRLFILSRDRVVEKVLAQLKVNEQPDCAYRRWAGNSICRSMMKMTRSGPSRRYCKPTQILKLSTVNLRSNVEVVLQWEKNLREWQQPTPAGIQPTQMYECWSRHLQNIQELASTIKNSWRSSSWEKRLGDRP